MKKILATGTAVLSLVFAAWQGMAEDKAAALFRGIDFYTGTSLKRPEEGMKKSELKADGGIGLRFKDATLMASFGLPYTAFNTQDICRALLQDKKALERYGADFHLGGEHFCFDTTLYAGTLRFGKGLSRIKKPSLASAAPLRKLSLLAPGISPSLPGFRSTPTPFALALSCKPSALTQGFPSMQFAYFENGDKAASLFKEIDFSSRPASKLSVAATAGSFTYGRKLSSAWFPQDRYIPKARYGAADIEVCLSLADLFRSSSAFGMTENPFGGLASSFFWTRTQDSFHIKCFTLNAAVFYSQNADMLLPTGKKLNIKSQTQFNPQFNFALPIGLVRAGVEIEKTERLSSGKINSLYNDYALKAALSYRYGRAQLDAHWNRKLTGKKHAVSYQVRLAFRYSALPCTYRATAGYSISAKGQTVTCTQTLEFPHELLSSIKFSGTLSFKDGQYDGGRFTASAGFSGNWAHTRWRGTVAFSASF